MIGRELKGICPDIVRWLTADTASHDNMVKNIKRWITEKCCVSPSG